MTVKWPKSEFILKIVRTDRNVPLNHIFDASLNIDRTIRYNGNPVETDLFGNKFNYKPTIEDLSSDDNSCDHDVNDYDDDVVTDRDVFSQESYTSNKGRRKEELINQIIQELNSNKIITPANRQYIETFLDSERMTDLTSLHMVLVLSLIRRKVKFQTTSVDISGLMLLNIFGLLDDMQAAYGRLRIREYIDPTVLQNGQRKTRCRKKKGIIAQSSGQRFLYTIEDTQMIFNFRIYLLEVFLAISSLCEGSRIIERMNFVAVELF